MAVLQITSINGNGLSEPMNVRIQSSESIWPVWQGVVRNITTYLLHSTGPVEFKHNGMIWITVFENPVLMYSGVPTERLHVSVGSNQDVLHFHGAGGRTYDIAYKVL